MRMLAYFMHYSDYGSP